MKKPLEINEEVKLTLLIISKKILIVFINNCNPISKISFFICLTIFICCNYFYLITKIFNYLIIDILRTSFYINHVMYSYFYIPLRMSTRVFVGGLTYRVRERDLEKFFRKYGRIKEVAMKNGFAFVVSHIYGRDKGLCWYLWHQKKILAVALS